MGKHSDKMYITHTEHALGSHSAAGSGKRAETGHQEMMRLPL
jgi:peptidyl-prolyl cis-trans isomerase-like protein 2